VLSVLTSRIKANPVLKRTALAVARAISPFIQGFHPTAIVHYADFLSDWLRFKRAGGKAAALDLYPCLFDKSASTRIDTHYFHQAIWAFRHIKTSGTESHVDIASEVNFVGLLTTITDVTFVDIRPLYLSIPNYHGVGASITSLPFESGSVPSLSCLHVIEHIGLGRYGDLIDPLGPEKAAREICRVLKPGGVAYISVPIGRPRVSFNGLRVFSAPEVVRLFAGLGLREMAMVDVPGNFIPDVDPAQADIRENEGGMDFGLGLFRFLKAVAVA
jgi:hypothetical protein